MTAAGRLLIRLARWIAGRERDDWTEAMAAEAASAGSQSTAWAVGCAYASLKDRLNREAWFLLAILLLPVCELVWKTLVFFSTASLLSSQWIPAWMAVATWILSPFPIVFLFTRWQQRSSVFVAVAISFAVVEFTPMLLMWIDFGISPLSWFGDNVHWYKADPNIAIGTGAGLTLDLFVWLAGAWLGSRASRRHAV